MSRIAKYPVPVPKGVEVNLAGGSIADQISGKVIRPPMNSSPATTADTPAQPASLVVVMGMSASPGSGYAADAAR